MRVKSGVNSFLYVMIFKCSCVVAARILIFLFSFLLSSRVLDLPWGCFSLYSYLLEHAGVAWAGFWSFYEDVMINHVFISFSSVERYNLSYIQLSIILFLIRARRSPCLVLDENRLVKNFKIMHLSTADIQT